MMSSTVTQDIPSNAIMQISWSSSIIKSLCGHPPIYQQSTSRTGKTHRPSHLELVFAGDGAAFWKSNGLPFVLTVGATAWVLLLVAVVEDAEVVAIAATLVVWVVVLDVLSLELSELLLGLEVMVDVDAG